MQPRKLNVAFCGFPYSGNGGGRSEHPALRNWLVTTVLAAKADPRVGTITPFDMADTPISMNRNAAVVMARHFSCDLLVMFDSDMHPDLYVGKDPTARPFFSSAFNFIYERWDQERTVVAAPYCSGPPHEYAMALEWVNHVSGEVDEGFKLELIGRMDAARRAGFENLGAAATGLIMYDMRIFDELPPPWFHYEYKGDGDVCPHCQQRKPGLQAEKSSTEDVQNTRDISLFFHHKYGYNPIWVNWDAWAGHYKSKLVEKPLLATVGSVGAKLQEAFMSGFNGAKTVMVGKDGPGRMGTLVKMHVSGPKTNGHAAPPQSEENGRASVSGVQELFRNYSAPQEVDISELPPPEECLAVADEGGQINRLVSTECVGIRVHGQRVGD